MPDKPNNNKVKQLIKELGMDSNIPMSFQKDEFTTALIKKGLESVLEGEMDDHLGYEKNDREKKAGKNKRNGHYERGYDTTSGRIDDLKIPRDRQGLYEAALLTANQARMEKLEEFIIELYATGSSGRDISELFREIHGHKLSAQTVSNITNRVTEEYNRWKQRPLEETYPFLFIDAIHQHVRRDTVNKDAIYLVGGVKLDGSREILGIYCLGGGESAHVWREVYEDLYHRGVRQILLAVMDGLPGNVEAFGKIFPGTDIQECAVHHLRAQTAKARRKDKKELARDMRVIFRCETESEAKDKLEKFKAKWGKRYPSIIKSWEAKWERLTTYLRYPSAIRRSIYTTNWLERMNREFKKVLKNKCSFPSEDAAMKLMYLRMRRMHKRYGGRLIHGWKDAEDDIKEMIRARFSTVGEKFRTQES